MGAAVEDRRLALRLSQQRAAVAADVGSTTWSKLEKGIPTSKATLVAVAQALGGNADTLLRVLAGEEPQWPSASSDDDRLAEVLARLAELAGEVRRLADLMDRLGGDA